MSFKVNTLGGKILKAERILNVEMIVINLMMLAILAALSVSLNNALLGLMSLGYFATGVTVFVSMVSSVVDVVLVLFE